MPDATTEATRQNWATHEEHLKEALATAQMQLGRIANHVGRSNAASVNRLQQKVVGITYDCERVLTRLRDRQNSPKAVL